MAENLASIVRAGAEAWLRLAEMAAAAEEAQWEPSNTPKPREDTTERSKGTHSDPVADTVADAQRLAVREAYKAAEAALRQGAEEARKIRHRLEIELDRWSGAGGARD